MLEHALEVVVGVPGGGFGECSQLARRRIIKIHLTEANAARGAQDELLGRVFAWREYRGRRIVDGACGHPYARRSRTASHGKLVLRVVHTQVEVATHRGGDLDLCQVPKCDFASCFLLIFIPANNPPLYTTVQSMYEHSKVQTCVVLQQCKIPLIF